jgi:hypothetical protein
MKDRHGESARSIERRPLPGGLLPLCVLLVSVLALANPASSGAAQETPVFDASLSLTGSCAEDATLDPVPDPGLCPMPPGVPGIDHPTEQFNNPKDVATDRYGNIYVATHGPEQAPNGHIDIFDPAGNYIGEVADPGADSLAVDSVGNLYVKHSDDDLTAPILVEEYVVYKPEVYDPENGIIEYEQKSTFVRRGDSGGELAVDPLNDHLYIATSRGIEEYSSLAESEPESNQFIEKYANASEVEALVPGVQAGGEGGEGIAVDAARNRIYSIYQYRPTPASSLLPVVVAVERAKPHAPVIAFKGADTPGGGFVFARAVAEDEGNGHVFVYDNALKRVYEFDESGTYISTIEHGFKYGHLNSLVVDNGADSPNGAENDQGRYLFVTSHPTGLGHVFAFGPPPAIELPEIESSSVVGITEDEAVVGARVNPKGAETTYRFEYLTQQQYEEAGETFAGALPAGEGSLSGNVGTAVSAPLTGLTPGTSYRYRVTADSSAGETEATGAFATYRSFAASTGCPNQSLRTGASALLPDCRAFELVTPSNTNSHVPLHMGHYGDYFPTRANSPSGNTLSFLVEGGAIPGYEGNSGLSGDRYVATRGADGWHTLAGGPNGAEAPRPDTGSASPDQGFSFWRTFEGSKLRYPDGHSEQLGRGTLENDPSALGLLISDQGGHVLFSSEVQLESNAPETGTKAIYDRTIDPLTGAEETHVVSLLPGGATASSAGSDLYQGASLDGRGVVFKIGDTLFLRHENQETYEIAEGATFAGVAEGGSRVFYLKNGDIWRFDVDAGSSQFTSSGDVVPVNVSADGSTAYFVSPTALSVEPNPQGALPVSGEENLYRSQEGAVDFVGTVTAVDVEGVDIDIGGEKGAGLGLWIRSVLSGQPVVNSSRSTDDGSALLFESRAHLTDYDPKGHREIYRYDAVGDTLQCLSCNPTGTAQGDATLASYNIQPLDQEPLTLYAYLENLTAGGSRAVFQSTEPLALGDTDGLQDVYEWEEDGSGSCRTPGGCVYLLTAGASVEPDYLVGTTPSGNDVFVRSADLLLPAEDPDDTPSIYDARVNGGFQSSGSPAECLGETCQPAARPPADPPAQIVGAGNVKQPPRRHCLRPKVSGKQKKGEPARRRCRSAKHKHRRHKRSAAREGANR